MRAALAAACVLFSSATFAASPDSFAEQKDGAMLHVASGFLCPIRIGSFERDAVGEEVPQEGSAYCAYSKLDGVYGTILLKPLSGPYDARASLAREFQVEEGAGGRMVGESSYKLSSRPDAPTAYQRSYETAHLPDAHYRALYTGVPFGNWTIEAVVEYAEPRDMEAKRDFLNAVFGAATAEIRPQAQPLAAAPPPR